MSNAGFEMPEIQIDLTNVTAWDGSQGPKLPIGAYTFDIVSAKQDTAKTSNQPVLEVTFRVADEGEFLGVEMTKKYSLQTKALGRVAQLMIAAGARLDAIRPAELIGARIIAEITHVPGQATVDAQGNVQESTKTYCDISKEQAVAQPEPAPAPPPAARKPAPAAAAAPAAPAPASTATKNGSVARRA